MTSCGFDVSRFYARPEGAAYLVDPKDNRVDRSFILYPLLPVNYTTLRKALLVEKWLT
jgi:hypothetical protein